MSGSHLSHDRPCAVCGHAMHVYLPCSDTCDCTPAPVPGLAATQPSGQAATRRLTPA